MAALNTSTWVPIDLDPNVEGREYQRSVIVDLARPRPMTTLEVDVPRFVDADVNGGSALSDDDSVADTVPMYAYQYNGKMTLDQAQHEDTLPNEIEAYSYEWLNSFHIAYDNASIGVSADRSATASNFLPYRSIYKAIRTNDNSGAVSYTADANYSNGSLSASGAFELLNGALGKVESSMFWDDQSGVVLLHPSLKQSIRSIKNPTTGQYMFIESSGGFPGGATQKPSYSFMGLPAYFTHGAIVSDTFKRTVTGNKLIVFANRKHLVHGARIEPQTRFIDASTNVTALEHTIQTRARKGFRLTVPNSCSVVEVTG